MGKILTETSFLWVEPSKSGVFLKKRRNKKSEVFYLLWYRVPHLPDENEDTLKMVEGLENTL